MLILLHPIQYKFTGMLKKEEQQHYQNDLQAINQYCSTYSILEQDNQNTIYHQEQQQPEEQDQHQWKITQSTKYQTFHYNKYQSLSPKHRQMSPTNSEFSCQSNSPAKNYVRNQSFYITMLKAPVKTIVNKEERFQFKILKIQRDLGQKLSSFRSRLIKGQNRYSHNSIKQIKQYVTATNYIAVFTDSKQPLLAENIHQKKQIASLTKIMTAFTVLCICQQFGIKVREHYIPINTRASYMEGTSANLKSGEEILIIDLLYGLLLPSGNDASIALAQYFGKFLSFKFVKDSESNEKSGSNIQKFNENRKFYDMQYQRDSIRLFVFEMNKYAFDIGMTNTKFVNPSGLTHVQNYSTAYDLAILTTICLKNHLLRLIFKRKTHKCNVINEKLGYNRQVIWKNTNILLYKVRECIGVKTGITPGAGACLSSAFRIGSRQLVVIVLESKDSSQRFNDSQRIYKWCLHNINYTTES